MKNLFRLCLIATVSVLKLMGETVVSPVEFAKMPLEEALKISNRTSGVYGCDDYAQAAVNSKRMDLIEGCFRSGVTSHNLRGAVAELPDSSYKDSLTLMMLETKSWFWPNYERSGSYMVVMEIDQQPFKAFIKKWLPNRKFDKEVTLESRQQLANEIRAAMAQAKSQEASDNLPSNESMDKIEKAGITASRPPKPSLQERESRLNEKESDQVFNWSWIIPAILAALFGSVLLFNKLRSRT